MSKITALRTVRITELPRLQGGTVLAPTAPGIGTALQPALRPRADAVLLTSGQPRC